MAGSAMSFFYDNDDTIKTLTAEWTSDDATGSVSGETEHDISGFLLSGLTNPGSPAPTDDYDITISDEDSYNVLTNCEDDLTDRDTSNTELVEFLLKDSAGDTAGGHPSVNGKLTIAVSNAGNSKQGTLKIKYI